MKNINVLFFFFSAVGSKTNKLFFSSVHRTEKKNLFFEIRTLFDEQKLERLLRTGHRFGFGLGLGCVEPVQQTPPPKDGRFWGSRRTPVRVLDGREAPGKFSLLYIQFPVLGFEIPVPRIFFQYQD